MPKANIIPVYDVNPRYSHQWKVESSKPGDWYTVSSRGLGLPFECSCRGRTSHTLRQDCKHIKAVKQNDKAIADEIKQQVADEIKNGVKKVPKASMERCPLCDTVLQYSPWTGDWSCGCGLLTKAAKTLGDKCGVKVKKSKVAKVAETVKELFTQSKIKIR